MSSKNKSGYRLVFELYYDPTIDNDLVGLVLKHSDIEDIPFMYAEEDCIGEDFVNEMDKTSSVSLVVDGISVNLFKTGKRYWAINKRIKGVLKKKHLGRIGSLTESLLISSVRELIKSFGEIAKDFIETSSLFAEEPKEKPLDSSLAMSCFTGKYVQNLRCDRDNGKRFLPPDHDGIIETLVGCSLAGHGKYREHIQTSLFGKSEYSKPVNREMELLKEENGALQSECKNLNKEIESLRYQVDQQEKDLLKTINHCGDVVIENSQLRDNIDLINECEKAVISRFQEVAAERDGLQAICDEISTSHNALLSIISDYRKMCQIKTRDKNRSYYKLIQFMEEVEIYEGRRDPIIRL